MASVRELNDRLLIDNIRLREKMAKIEEILEETIESILYLYCRYQVEYNFSTQTNETSG